MLSPVEHVIPLIMITGNSCDWKEAARIKSTLEDVQEDVQEFFHVVASTNNTAQSPPAFRPTFVQLMLV